MHPVKSQPQKLDWWYGTPGWFKWTMLLDILVAICIVVAVIAPYNSTLEVAFGVPGMIGGVVGAVFTIMGVIDSTDSYSKRHRVARLEKHRRTRGLPRNGKVVYDAVPKGEMVEIWMGTYAQGWSRLREYHAENDAEAAHEYWSNLTAAPEIFEGHTSEAKALANSLTGGKS